MEDDALKRVIDMMAALRDPQQGCPWDKKQTLQSLTPHTLEETHEVIAAIEQQNFDDLKDELGDLLFQIVFYCQIASEQNQFNLSDVMHHLVDKMQRRHPHVFAGVKFETESELSQHWEATKAQERHGKNEKHIENSVLDNIPNSMPALSKSQKLQNRAAKTGFDWDDIEMVKNKLAEEIEELNKAIIENNRQNIEHEIGDLLTACVNLARHVRVDAEQALRLANQRFINRFQYIENHLQQNNKDILDTQLEELEQLWQQAKAHLQDNKY